MNSLADARPNTIRSNDGQSTTEIFIFSIKWKKNEGSTKCQLRSFVMCKLHNKTDRSTNIYSRLNNLLSAHLQLFCLLSFVRSSFLSIRSLKLLFIFSPIRFRLGLLRPMCVCVCVLLCIVCGGGYRFSLRQLRRPANRAHTAQKPNK